MNKLNVVKIVKVISVVASVAGMVGSTWASGKENESILRKLVDERLGK